MIFEWIDMVLIKNNYKTVDVAESIGGYIEELENGEKFQYGLYQSVGKYIQYVLVLDIGNAEIKGLNLGMKQRLIYKSLLELGDTLEPEFDKNVSFLICVNNSIEEKNLEREVLKTEEDPYCFKKFVLTYTEKEIKFLVKQTKKTEIWDYMQQIMNGLREGNINFSDAGVEFILRLFIKLPFLPANIAKRQEKTNLMEEIEANLEEKYSKIWETIKGMDIKEIEGIKDYTEEQIDDILNKWCVEEEQ